MTRATMRISSLPQYPIKSCAGMPLERVEVDDSVIADREAPVPPKPR